MCGMELQTDLDDNIVNVAGNFADDSKISGLVDNEERYLSLEKDHDQLGKRAKE